MSLDLKEQLQLSLGSAIRLERELSGGSMSRVFVATEAPFGRRIIVKVLPPDYAGTISVERFRREIKLAVLLHHPHIVPLLHADERDGLIFYTMPFIDGETLQDRLNRESQLPIPDAVRIAREIADALDYAHQHGVIHRDIKPSNVLLQGGHALVTDFGIARAIVTATEARNSQGRLTGPGASLGTPLYMSPEQAAGERDLDVRTDIYSLGCVLFEMLVGQPPFAGANSSAILARHWSEAPRSVRALRSPVTEALENVVQTALAKVPADRYATAAAMAAALRSAAETGSQRATPSPAPPRRRHVSRNHILLAGGAIAIAAVALLAWLAPFRWRSSPPTAGIGVAIAPFGETLPDSTATMARLVAGALEWTPGIRPLDLRASLASASPTLPELFGAARRGGAAYLVRGSWERGGPQARLLVTIYATASELPVLKRYLAAESRDDRSIAESVALDIIRTIAEREHVDLGVRGSLGSATTSAVTLGNLLLAQRRFVAGAYDDAATALRAAIDADSACGLAYFRLSVVETWRHDYPAALAAVERGELHASRMAARWSALLAAQRHYVRRDGDSAIAAFQLAVLTNADDIDAWWGLGESLFHFAGLTGHDVLDARAAFERVESLDSTFSPSADHLAHLAIWRRDTAAAVRLVARLRDADAAKGPMAAAIRLWLSDADTRRSAMAALHRADRSTLSALAELAAFHAFDLPLLDSIGHALRAVDRVPDDRRRGAEYQLAARAATGQWTGAVAQWRPDGENGSVDGWLLTAHFAGYPVPADDVDRMIATARARVRDGRAPKFALPDWDDANLDFAALVSLATIGGDSAQVRALQAAAQRSPATDRSDPLRESLLGSLDARLALLAHDSARAIALLSRTLSRNLEPAVAFYPLLGFAPQRMLRAELAASTNDRAALRRWLGSFDNSRSIGDLFYAERVRRMRAREPR